MACWYSICGATKQHVRAWCTEAALSHAQHAASRHAEIGYLMAVSAEVVRMVGSCLSWPRGVGTCLSRTRGVVTCLSWKTVAATSKSCCGLHRYPDMRTLNSLR